MSAHTPGPWQQKSEYEPLEIVGNIDDATDAVSLYTKVCTVTDDYDDIDSFANARLIAAAPEMLAALQNVRTSRLTNHNEAEAWGWVDAAIAKATGAKP